MLQPLDIVLVNTAAGKAVGNPNFVNIGCGMGYEATMYLTTRGVRVTGTDAWSWDAPFSHTAKKVAETGDYSLVWEGHKAGRDIGYCHLEKLHNLEVLPPRRIHRLLLSAQDPRRLGRLDARGGDLRGVTRCLTTCAMPGTWPAGAASYGQAPLSRRLFDRPVVLFRDRQRPATGHRRSLRAPLRTAESRRRSTATCWSARTTA